MTASENKALDRISSIIGEMRQSNQIFMDSVNTQVKSINDKVDQKQIPFSLEKEILQAVQNSIGKAIAESLGGYNSPLQKYAANVVSRYQNSIESIFDDIVKEGIGSDEFKVRVREVLLNKIAKTVVSGIDGSIDKTINLMKQDAVFRSRLTLSVNSLVDEFLNKKHG